MFKKLWHKLTSHRQQHPHQSYRSASKELGIPKSTIHSHDKRLDYRKGEMDEVSANFLQSEQGQIFLKRLLISSIYTFCIKGGLGAGRIEEFMKQMQVDTYMGVSRTSIHRMIKEIETSILMYQQVQERGIEEAIVNQKAYLEVVLGLDETWLSDMLLVCQELTSGYIFLKSQAQVETAKVGKHKSTK